MMLTGEKDYRSSFVSAHFKLQTCSSFTEAIIVILDLKKKSNMKSSLQKPIPTKSVITTEIVYKIKS